MTRPATLADLNAALHFGRAPKRGGSKPFAGPTPWHNEHATQVTDRYMNIERDGPRRLDETGVPYYKTLPQGVVAPIVLEAKARPLRGLLALDRAKFRQLYVDLIVAVHAIRQALALYKQGDKEQAAMVLQGHLLHVSMLFVSTMGGMGFLLAVLFT